MSRRQRNPFTTTQGSSQDKDKETTIQNENFNMFESEQFSRILPAEQASSDDSRRAFTQINGANNANMKFSLPHNESNSLGYHHRDDLDKEPQLFHNEASVTMDKRDQQASRKRELGASKSAMNVASQGYGAGSNSVGDYQEYERHGETLKQQEIRHKLDQFKKTEA